MRSRYSPSAVAAFERLFRPWMRRRVHAVHLAGLPAELPSACPLLLVPNHVSWWDAFVVREVQRLLRPGTAMFTVMREAELKRVPFFRQMGVVGIEPGAPTSVARALRLLHTRVRERPDSAVLFFPQGRIWPAQRRPLGFQRGVERFARTLGARVLPVAIHPEMLNHVTPTFFVSVGAPIDYVPDVVVIERAVEAQLDAIGALLTSYGEDAQRLWPGPYARLPAAPEAARSTA